MTASAHGLPSPRKSDTPSLDILLTTVPVVSAADQNNSKEPTVKLRRKKKSARLTSIGGTLRESSNNSSRRDFLRKHSSPQLRSPSTPTQNQQQRDSKPSEHDLLTIQTGTVLGMPEGDSGTVNAASSAAPVLASTKKKSTFINQLKERSGKSTNSSPAIKRSFRKDKNAPSADQQQANSTPRRQSSDKSLKESSHNPRVATTVAAAVERVSINLKSEFVLSANAAVSVGGAREEAVPQNVVVVESTPEASSGTSIEDVSMSEKSTTSPESAIRSASRIPLEDNTVESSLRDVRFERQYLSGAVPGERAPPRPRRRSDSSSVSSAAIGITVPDKPRVVLPLGALLEDDDFKGRSASTSSNRRLSCESGSETIFKKAAMGAPSIERQSFEREASDSLTIEPVEPCSNSSFPNSASMPSGISTRRNAAESGTLTPKRTLTPKLLPATPDAYLKSTAASTRAIIRFEELGNLSPVIQSEPEYNNSSSSSVVSSPRFCSMQADMASPLAGLQHVARVEAPRRSLAPSRNSQRLRHQLLKLQSGDGKSGMLGTLDSHMLYMASGEVLTFASLREKIAKRGNGKKIAVLILCNFLARDVVRQFDDSLERALGEDEQSSGVELVVVGAGPAKFIAQFCTRADVENLCRFSDDLDNNADCNSPSNSPAYVVADMERAFYHDLTMFEAARCRARDARGAPKSSTDIANDFYQFSKLTELSTKGAKHQYLAYFIIDVACNEITHSEMISEKKYKCS
eukprot:CAMPEP_0185856634 /NCGR_PEP_ID=MMETSP1354-20130828/29097_1 /TAXON_ID=708628 /ORGANISM="Erythrolobus madagascarensis, Strain CCMP3276" /LENGTH=745 /DNA_ID=CAMNT_0028558895 /DNA_START=162 /DNA_END=2399 /DNA_ORIENTATION=-